MPTEDVNPAAILRAVRKIDILAELLEKENQNNLKMLVEGKVSGGKQIGPYARVLTFAPGEEIMRQGEWGGNTFYFATDAELDVLVAHGEGAEKKTGRISPGSCFGEMSVLAGVPRNATVVAPADGPPVKILEVVRPALRLLRSLKKFAETVDTTYRGHGVQNTIARLQEGGVGPLAAEDLVALGNLGEFMAYGKHHVMAQEGKPIERLVLIRSGWIRRVRGVPIFVHTLHESGPSVFIPEDFVGAGNCLGLEALTGQATWPYSAASMARSEVFEVPLTSLRQDRRLADRVLKAFSTFSVATDTATLQARSEPRVLAAAEKEIATGIVDAVNLLVMDMDLCIRCGNCSLACHKVHGQSRLLRRGIQIQRPVTPSSNRTQHVLAPSVCMHCKDPECLTGCPTTAIYRDPKGHVEIDLNACIGCFDCATQCPYNAISMVPRAGTPAAESDDMVAIKCNLCANTPLNPTGASRLSYSCEENCPTGALVRVDPQKYFDEVDQTLGLVFRDETHAIGRNIHKRDPLAIAWHAGGGFLLLLIVALLGVTAFFFGFETPLIGTWLNLRWLTGLVGLGGVAMVMTYPLRKSIYRHRAGALRYWLLAHIYAGSLAGIVLLMHGGRHGGGLLTATLMISFDLVVLTGLFGLGCYLIVPRIMTSIEGDPLLIEDLQGRAAELREELAHLNDTSGAEIKQLIARIRKRFSSFSFLLRQYFQREQLSSLSARGRLEFRAAIEAPADKTQREQLVRAVDSSITLRRVESLIYLHRILKLWLAPHVISTSVMLILLVAHIIQVVYFRVP
ncbi:MAG TPA: cyclic nucleotide-binding domain-containing protein [Pyrinomonadaceae bacterium]|nr:cyclic nucleotide-binding domain-containing protein [Pyrinomonadaceae bacterium]